MKYDGMALVNFGLQNPVNYCYSKLTGKYHFLAKLYSLILKFIDLTIKSSFSLKIEDLVVS